MPDNIDTALPDTPQVRIIHHGVDTFLVNYKMANEDGTPTGDALPAHVADLLDTWQQAARADHTPVPTDLTFTYTVPGSPLEHAQTLFMRGHGSDVWSWLLYCDDLKLNLSHGTLNRGLFAQARFSSHLLCMLGPESAMIQLEALLYSLLGGWFHKQASEIHLCADVQGVDFSNIDPHRSFVSRVVRIRERPEPPSDQEQQGGLSPRDIAAIEHQIEQDITESLHAPFLESAHRRIATIDFGSHGTALSAQIYNKSNEIKKHRKDWFEVLWRASGHYDPALPVWRVEFRFKRKFLHDFSLDEAYSTLAHLSALWHYATVEWLRLIDLSACDDSNRSRLPTHPAWSVIQSAYPDDSLTDQAPSSVEAETALRLSDLLDARPSHVLEEAAVLSLASALDDDPSLCLAPDEVAASVFPLAPGTSCTRLALSVLRLSDLLESRKQRRLTDNRFSLRDTFADSPADVVRSLAAETVATLSPADLSALLARLSPEPFDVVRASLIKRTRRMAKRRACIAGGIGYIRSAVALAPDDELPDGSPDLLASLAWFWREMVAYDTQKNRSHLEEVWKKRLAYNFITAHQLDEERRTHGVVLLPSDWSQIDDVLTRFATRPVGNDPTTHEPDGL